MLALLVPCLLAACQAPGLDGIEPGMRPQGVHTYLGSPQQSYLADRQSGFVRKMLVEEYPSPPGHILQLMYAIPADIDELAAQGDLDWARRVAPSLAQGVSVASLPAATRQRINMRCARLLRYRRLALRKKDK